MEKGKVMKLTRIAFIVITVFFAAVSAHAQYSCYDGNLNGKYVLGGGGKKVTLNLLGVVDLEQEHNTVGYLVFDGNGNITDGKIDEELDSVITEHTGVIGTYSLSGQFCNGTLTIQASGYNRTFNLQGQFPPFKGVSGTAGFATVSLGFSLLPNGGNGEDEDYTASLTQDPTTSTLSAKASTAKLTTNASGGCTADIFTGDTFTGTVDGGTGGNVTKGTMSATFFDSGSGPQVTWMETDVTNGVPQLPTTNTYPVVVNPDCSFEVDSGSTKVGEMYLSRKVSISNQATDPTTNTLTWVGPNGKWGKGEWQSW
jgi:hypothetical protein